MKMAIPEIGDECRSSRLIPLESAPHVVAKKRVKVVSAGTSECFRNNDVSTFPEDDKWKEFQEQYPDDGRLEPSVIYALPNKLLNLIHQYVPSFLTDDELEFERRLRHLSGSGFRNRRAFAYEILDISQDAEGAVLDHSNRRDRLMRKMDLGMHDHFAADPKQLAKTRNQLMTRFAERLQGFAGWLVTNPQFRLETAELAEQWESVPTLRVSYPDLQVLEKAARFSGSSDELHKIYKTVGTACHFLRRWNLVRMETWDLPVPMPPVHVTDDPLPRNELQSMGVSLFVPWSLLADRDLKIDELVDYHQERQDLLHLNGWMAKGRATSWGVERHAKMLAIFVYVERGLKIRYPGRLHGHTSKLDIALRAFWGPQTADMDALKAGAETVRKTREELRKRLNAIH